MYDVQKGDNIALPGGPLWIVPELLFESKKLISALQQLTIDKINDRIILS
jgi:hypothetical protein